MKNKIQEKMWLEAGETVEGLKKLLNERTKNNKLWQELSERKNKEKQ